MLKLTPEFRVSAHPSSQFQLFSVSVFRFQVFEMKFDFLIVSAGPCPRSAVEKYVRHDAAFDRPIDPTRLVGCADKIREMLKWKPSGWFQNLVREMVNAELEILKS